MAVRKKEIDRARERILRPVISMIDSPYFRRRIKKARLELGIDPARRRAHQAEVEKLSQEDKLQLERRNQAAKELLRSLGEALSRFPEKQRATEVRGLVEALDAADQKTIAEYCAWEKASEAAPRGFPSDAELPTELPQKVAQAKSLYRGLTTPERIAIDHYRICLPYNWYWVPTMTYFAALCFDFEGTERDDFLTLALSHLSPVKIESWHSGLAWLLPFDKHLEGFLSRLQAKPNHIYLDVTEATPDDVAAIWGDVIELQRRMGITHLGPGRPRGSHDQELEQRDARIVELWDKVKPMRLRKDSRYKNKYDMVAKMYGVERRLPEAKWPAPDTVKAIIRKHKVKTKLGALVAAEASLSEQLEGMAWLGGLTPNQLRQSSVKGENSVGDEETNEQSS